MKRFLSSICSVVFAGLVALSFYSCTRVEEIVAPEENEIELNFDIDVVIDNGPDTRVVKTDWEEGDKIFIFFRKPNNGNYIDPSKYVTITYNGSSWDTSVDSGSEMTLNFSTFGSPNSGTMYAVFFPFGGVQPESGKFISRGHTNTALNGIPPFSFYMVDNGSPYTLSGSVTSTYTVSGTLTMALPENFVYFYIDAADGKYNESEKYRLSVEGVKPAAVNAWNKSSGFSYYTLGSGEPMWGYKYGNGICFAGIIDETWATEANNHKLIFFEDGEPALTKILSGKTLTSHASVNLSAPTAMDANGWVRYMAAPDFVEIAGNKWSKWFLGSTAENDVTSKYLFRWSAIVPNCGNTEFGTMQTHSITGDYVIYDPARAILGADWRMPNRSDFSALITDATLTTSNDWFTFTAGGNSIKVVTHNALYHEGGSNYLWTSEVAGSIYSYVREYHVGENAFPEVSSGTGDAVKRANGSNFIRPIYVGDGGSVEKEGYTQTPLQ